MSGFYEPCSFCSAWVRGDELDNAGACLACQATGAEGCMYCHDAIAEWASNLCLPCAESLRVAPLLALAGKGVSVQLRDERLWGMARGLWLHEGIVKLVLATYDEGVFRHLPLQDIVCLEVCVQDALSGGGLPTGEFVAWEKRERQAELVLSAVVSAGSAGRSHAEGDDDEAHFYSDNEDYLDDFDAAAAIAERSHGASRDTRDLLAALGESYTEEDAIDALVRQGYIVDPRLQGPEPWLSRARRRLISWRLRRLLKRLLWESGS